VFGPILPNYWIESWWKPFVNVLDANDNIRLVGSSVSCFKIPHVQSFMFAMDYRGLEIVSSTWDCAGHQETIDQMELGQSKKIRDAGYGIASMFHALNLVNFTSLCNDKENTFLAGVVKNYFPSMIEMIFVRRGWATPDVRAVYDRYMIQSEHMRINCPQCWKNSNCYPMCSSIG